MTESLAERPVDPVGLPPRFARSLLATYGSTAVVGVATLLVTPLLAHALGVADFGLWAFATTVAAYVNLADLGISNATTKLVAEDAGRDPDAVVQVFSVNFFVLCVMAVLAALGGLAFAVAAPYLFHVPEVQRRTATVAFAVIAGGVALTLPVNTYFGVLSGYQRYDLIALCNSVTGGGVAVTSAIVVLAGGRLVALAVAFVCIIIAAAPLPIVLAHRLVPGLRIRRSAVSWSGIRRTTSLSLWYLLQGASAVMAQELDLLVVGVAVGAEGVGIYAIAAKLGQLAEKALGPLQQVFFPHTSAVSASAESANRLRAVLIDGTRAVLAVSCPVALVCILLAPQAVEAWVGPRYAASAPILEVIGLTALAGGVTTAAWQLLGGLGRARLAGVIGLGEATVNLVASVALVRPLGPVGVAFGTLIGTVAVNVPLIVRAASRLVHVRVWEWVRSWSVHLVPGLVTAGFLLSASRVVPGTRLAVALTSFGALLVYEVLLLGFTARRVEGARFIAGVRRGWRSVRDVAGHPPGAGRWIEGGAADD